MSFSIPKQAQILIALQAVPLDRIRLMKTLFLVWHRGGRPAADAFDFIPYLYAPCAFDLYGVLRELEQQGLIIQPSHQSAKSASYYLTDAGKRAASEGTMILDDTQIGAIQETARWAAKQGFRSLLDTVYAEAPDFATSSVLRREASTS